MKALLFALTFQACRGWRDLTGYRTPLNEANCSAPCMEGLTEIFRTSIRSAFSDVALIDGVVSGVIAPDGCKVERCAVFYSPRSFLDETEGDDFIVVFCINIESLDMGQLAKYSGKDGKFELIRRCGYGDFISKFTPSTINIVGHRSYMCELFDADMECINTYLLIYAFYTYAWVLLLRVERDQQGVKLFATKRHLGECGASIMKQRLRMVNLRRYFFTNDRSNNQYIKKYCSDIFKSFHLSRRYEHIAVSHRGFEYYLSSAANLVQNAELGTVSGLVLISTILSVPINFFAAVMAINISGGSVFVDPSGVYRNVSVYSVLGVGICFLTVPFVLIKLRDIILRILRRKQKW